jgi:hypothetical protein
LYGTSLSLIAPLSHYPLYTFHKILSIVTLSSQLTKEYGETVVPVFWIAGGIASLSGVYLETFVSGGVIVWYFTFFNCASFALLFIMQKRRN